MYNFVAICLFVGLLVFFFAFYIIFDIWLQFSHSSSKIQLNSMNNEECVSVTRSPSLPIFNDHHHWSQLFFIMIYVALANPPPSNIIRHRMLFNIKCNQCTTASVHEPFNRPLACASRITTDERCWSHNVHCRHLILYVASLATTETEHQRPETTLYYYRNTLI